MAHRDPAFLGDGKPRSIAPQAAAPLPRRPFGATDRHFCPLGLGTASLAGVNMIGAGTYRRLSCRAVAALLTAAIDQLAGHDALMLDTSAQYGESEARLGEFLAAHPAGRGRVYLATKWGLRYDPRDFTRQDYTRENLLASVETSARRLGRIDLLYLHTNPGTTTESLDAILRGRDGLIDTMRTFKRTRRCGIAHLGISVSTPDNLELVLASGELLHGFDALQLTARLLLDHEDLAGRLRHSSLGIVLNSPYRKADPRLRAVSEGLRTIYHRILDVHPSAVLLTGTRSLRHLRENVAHVGTWAGLR